MSALVTVDFHGDTLEAVQDPDGTIWVSIKRISDILGIDAVTQTYKLKRKAWATTGQRPVVAEDGKIRFVSVVDLDSLPGWLFTIDSMRVACGVRDKLIRYQRECAKVLADHFYGPRPARPSIPKLRLPHRDWELELFAHMRAFLVDLVQELAAVERMDKDLYAAAEKRDDRLRQTARRLDDLFGEDWHSVPNR